MVNHNQDIVTYFQKLDRAFFMDALKEFAYKDEAIPIGHERAKERLDKAGFSNIHFKLDDGSSGWEEHAPYNRIMVTAAAAQVPGELMDQLAIGGKMIIPVGTPLLQELLLLEKDEDGEIHTTVLNEVRFVPLKGKYE
jgi:protein-L-isoaspartate(D-aspartate) O-methyltransferase